MIDKTAIIDSKAKLSKNVQVGPYCVIGPNVEIGEDTVIHSHDNISGNPLLLSVSSNADSEIIINLASLNTAGEPNAS